jgi:hypothetical protein
VFVFEHPIGTQSEFRAVLIGSYHSNIFQQYTDYPPGLDLNILVIEIPMILVERTATFLQLPVRGEEIQYRFVCHLVVGFKPQTWGNNSWTDRYDTYDAHMYLYLYLYDFIYIIYIYVCIYIYTYIRNTSYRTIVGPWSLESRKLFLDRIAMQKYCHAWDYSGTVSVHASVYLITSEKTFINQFTSWSFDRQMKRFWSTIFLLIIPKTKTTTLLSSQHLRAIRKVSGCFLLRLVVRGRENIRHALGKWSRWWYLKTGCMVT